MTQDQTLVSGGKKRRAIRIALLLAVVCLLIWGAACAALLLQARERADDGLERLTALIETDPLDADPEALRAELGAAAVEFGGASRRLNSPILWPLRPLPVVGRQVASARALAGSADQVVEDLLVPVGRVIDGRSAASLPAERMQLLADLEQDLSRAVSTVDGADLGPDEALVAPLAEARFDAQNHLARLSGDLTDAHTVVRGLRRFLEGSDYLVLAANPAEMMNAGGMYLAIGHLATNGAELELTEFAHTGDYFPLPPSGVSDPDVERHWGFLLPDNDFRKLNLTPRFTAYSGPQALQMWEARTGQRPTGALVVDAVVIQALLRVVGSVEVDGVEHDADTMLAYALVEQYRMFGDVESQSERKELVDAIAREAVAALGERSWDPLELVRELRASARGRHLLAYSEEESQQALWSTLGVTGETTGAEILVNLANIGGQKMDPFVDLQVHVEEVPGDVRTLRFHVDVANMAPPDLSRFAAGRANHLDVPAGTYLGRLVVFGPGGRSRIDLGPDRELQASGPDGNLQIAATMVQIEPGDHRFTFDIVLDPDLREVIIVPAGRVPAATWHWRGETWQDVEPRTLQLD